MSASVNAMFSRFSRLCINQAIAVRTVHTQVSPLLFKVSEQLCAEPMKKKKKVDPMKQFAKEAKKLKKIEREIRRLDKKGRILKPIDELDSVRRLSKELELRKRERTVLSFDEMENRVLLYKDWTRYKAQQRRLDCITLRRLQNSQTKALDELRKESEDLYQKAIQIDEGMLALNITGPLSTPPIKSFEPTDGEYVDKTRKYDETEIEIPKIELTSKRRR
ncbi:hypothetical protein SNE40_017091 [Patella caerulea]|uniref:Large ribosomal subunit protein mL40 n=1 Tax=Patella caerulea TaxID=87958 RepID=A0AAN8PF37_PATCE